MNKLVLICDRTPDPAPHCPALPVLPKTADSRHWLPDFLLEPSAYPRALGTVGGLSRFEHGLSQQRVRTSLIKQTTSTADARNIARFEPKIGGSLFVFVLMKLGLRLRHAGIGVSCIIRSLFGS